VVVVHLVESRMSYSFRGNLVNCSNTIAEEAVLVAVQCLQGYCLCTVPSTSNLSRMHAVFNRVGSSVAK
jgi:hypothetical protein